MGFFTKNRRCSCCAKLSLAEYALHRARYHSSRVTAKWLCDHCDYSSNSFDNAVVHWFLDGHAIRGPVNETLWTSDQPCSPKLKTKSNKAKTISSDTNCSEMPTTPAIDFLAPLEFSAKEPHDQNKKKERELADLGDITVNEPVQPLNCLPPFQSTDNDPVLEQYQTLKEPADMVDDSVTSETDTSIIGYNFKAEPQNDSYAFSSEAPPPDLKDEDASVFDTSEIVFEKGENECTNCGIALNWKTKKNKYANTIDHVRFCLGIQPFVCSECQYKSASRSNVVKHIKRKCPEGQLVKVNKEDVKASIKAGLQICFPTLDINFGNGQGNYKRTYFD